MKLNASSDYINRPYPGRVCLHFG